MWYIWLIISGLAIIIEFFTVGFLVFWFSIGALITMVVSFFTDSIFIQTSVFIVTSTILIFATKPFLKHFDIPNPLRSNVYSLTDKIGIVIQEINSSNTTGQIKVDGETWTAITENPALVIPEGSKVRILKIKGVKAVVTKI